MRCYESIVTGETVNLVEHDDHTANGRCRNESAEEFPCLLLFGRCAEPVTDLEVGDKSASHGKRGADHTSDHHGSHDARGAAESD